MNRVQEPETNRHAAWQGLRGRRDLVMCRNPASLIEQLASRAKRLTWPWTGR